MKLLRLVFAIALSPLLLFGFLMQFPMLWVFRESVPNFWETLRDDFLPVFKL